MSQYQDNNIEPLSEWLESLQIINEASGRTTEYTNKILTALVPTQDNNGQAEIPKNIVPDPGWFNGNRTKFED